MNYYQYRRRAPQKRGVDYIKPFLVILILAGIVVAGWRLLGSLFGGPVSELSSEKVYLEVESGSARARTAGGETWSSIPTAIDFYEGESVRTQSDGRVTLTFFDNNTARLDKSSELTFKTLEEDGLANFIELELAEGKLWGEVDADTDSSYVILTDLLSVSAQDAVFSVTYPGMLYVIEGQVTADVMDKDEIVKTTTVGVGQQLIVDEAVVADLGEGLDKEIIFAIEDAFKTSNWYRWNRQKGQMIADETEEESVPEEETEMPAEADEEEEEADPNDKEPPSMPQIKEPGENGDTVTLEEVEANITGTVSADTETVIVNDYRLTRYIPGSGEFKYTAFIDFENLEVGENEYEVIAEDKAGNKSEAAMITLILPQEVYDEHQEETEAEEESGSGSQTPEASSSGGVSITSPNGGENLITSETSFNIEGTVPEGTAKVLVNDYQLQAFEEGDTSFLYRANSTLGTLKIGKLNTYEVEAYNADGKLLGSASMTIDVESSESGSGDPLITIPTSDASYSTTLDQIVVGGTVGKWVDMVYLNEQKLNDYIPGSGEWKSTVKLSPGSNTFKVYGTTDGDQTATASITIDYQN